jgi:hypothetical protein
MSATRTRFLLMMGALSTLLCTSAPARAERRLPAWNRTSLVQLTASREALGPVAGRAWGASVPLDEAYAGPWASSPLAMAPRASVLNAASPHAAASTGGASNPSDASRSADAVLGRLGPIGLLASIVVPAAMVRSSKGATTRVGVTKMAGGYGLVVAGRF